MSRKHFHRRDFLKLAGASAAGTLLASRFTGRTLAQSVVPSGSRADYGVSVYPFPLSRVTLLAGPFKDNMNRAMSYLSFIDSDRMLHTFRLNVGISSSATPCGGWESPTTELRGHSMGHLLSGLAMAYANTGTSALKTKGDYLVAELAKCQARSPQAGFHTGYLSAYPENFFDRLEANQSVWAPYYTIHKIMAGLLDQYLLAGNTQALDVLKSKASWVNWRTGRLSNSQMQSVMGNEFGGMNEVLTNLYQLTGDSNHIATAQRFDHAAVFDPLANNQDQLNGLHANTQIPKMTGAIREYHQTQTARYRTIATNFWNIVVDHHSYCIGGNSENEHFYAPNAISGYLTDKDCEVCNTYNMLKLSRQLFFTDPSQSKYMDYYEKGLYNMILAEQDPNSSHGFVSYFLPLRAGGIKTYSNDYDDFTCDHGTGMESQNKFADSIYFFSGNTLYVNLFIASQLNWSEKGITVRQDTSYPEQSSTRLTITGSGAMPIKIRVPSWCKSGWQVAVNGSVQNVAATPGSYATLDRTWANGDVIDVTMPQTLSLEPTPDNSGVQAVKYGGMVLAGGYGTTDLNSNLPTLDPASVKATSTPLQFTANANSAAVTLIPFYKMHHQRYTVYWKATGNIPGSDTQAPSTPGTPAASNVGSTSLTLTWAASTDDVGVTGYTVYQRTSSGDVVAATPSTNSAAIGSLSPSTSYTFYVKARDAAGNTSAASATVAVTTSAGTGGGTISVNAGGSATGSFLADAYYSGGSTYSNTNAIDTSQITGNVPPQAVFQSERYGELTYTIPGLTAGATCQVTLYFEESYWTAAGQRTFNVAINGSAVLTAFDIFAAAGGANKAIARTFDATANASGQVVIQFTKGGGPDNPKICGITVASTGTPPPPPPPPTLTVSVNAGGSAAGSFVADANYSGGSTYTNTNAIDTSQITGNVPPQAVFQSERYGACTYTIPGLTAGATCQVTLYFEESYVTAAGQRLFNVAINGTTVLSAFDIFAAAGGANKAIARTFTAVANASGQVVIAFTAGSIQSPKICGITVTGS